MIHIEFNSHELLSSLSFSLELMSFIPNILHKNISKCYNNNVRKCKAQVQINR